MGIPISKKTLDDTTRKVGVVFQDPDDQVFSTTVWEDVKFGPENMGLSNNEISQRCHTALGSVGMLEYRESPPYELSYGQRKRVAIAGVLAMQPDIIILDEPMAYLDPKGKDEVRSLLQGLYFMGKTILVATHDVDFAASWADQVILLEEGKVLVEGGTELLVQEEWLDKASLHLPQAARPFKLLGGLRFDRLPRTDREAARMIAKLQAKINAQEENEAST